LGNFRDLDYHFVAPILFKPGAPQQLSIQVTCKTPGPTTPPDPPLTQCKPAVVFSGVYGTLP
jgi:hypothetical protein